MDREIFILLPSLGLSGGTIEVLNLSEDLKKRGCKTTLIVFWRHKHEISARNNDVIHLSQLMQSKFVAAFSIPFLLLRILFGISSEVRKSNCVIATHFITVPASILFNRNFRYIFVQGLEWNFFTGLKSKVVKYLILNSQKYANLIFANIYLQSEFGGQPNNKNYLFPIWANLNFLSESPLMPTSERKYDIVFVLREDKNKRPDLYRAFTKYIKKCRQYLYIACITPDPNISPELSQFVDLIVVDPNIEEMKAIYCNSKFFLHLSDSEGFGLPPLESMGCGCIPYCRDSGGVRQYLFPGFEKLIFPRDMSIDELCEGFIKLSLDKAYLSELSTLSVDRFTSGHLEVQQCRMNELDRFVEYLSQ